MSRIRGKDTTPEKRVRSFLHCLGSRFRFQFRIPVGEMRNSPKKVQRTSKSNRGWTRMNADVQTGASWPGVSVTSPRSAAPLSLRSKGSVPRLKSSHHSGSYLVHRSLLHRNLEATIVENASGQADGIYQFTGYLVDAP